MSTSAGRTLEVTVRGVADETAAAADLVKGKAAGTPVAVVSGLGAHVTADDGPGAAVLVRDTRGDWFRHGHVEAAWLALGHGSDESPSIDPGSEDLDHRVARAVRIALAPLADEVGVEVSVVDGATREVLLRAEGFALGRAVERLRVAAWAEDLVTEVGTPGGSEVGVRMAYGVAHV